MTTKETVKSILSEIKPTVNLDGVTDIIDGGFLDSMELMGLISALMDTFGIDIDVDYISPENFNSIDAMAAMIDKIKG